jgi:RNA polymerase sigma-70 factor (ECF subfamily)
VECRSDTGATFLESGASKQQVSKLVDIAVGEELIAAARSGDPQAQARLYTLLGPATFGLIRRLVGTRAVAEDLFQETMMSVYAHLSEFRGEAPLGAWVRRIAVSKCLMHLRSPWHRARLDLGWFAEEDLPATLSLPMAPESLDVERALASLAPTARAVVWLFEVEGYSHQEIAQAFGRSCSFSKSQLARAHRRLRAWFEPRTEREPCSPV